MNNELRVPGNAASRATPNLPSRDLEGTSSFYAVLGFSETFRDEGWLIVERGGMQIEFFLHPDLDPRTNIASCCLRVPDAGALRDSFLLAGIPNNCDAIPRITGLAEQPWGMKEFALIDPDGNLLRCLSTLTETTES